MGSHNVADAFVHCDVIRVLGHAVLIKGDDDIDGVFSSFTLFCSQVFRDLVRYQVFRPLVFHTVLQVGIINYDGAVVKLQVSTSLFKLLGSDLTQALVVAI